MFLLIFIILIVAKSNSYLLGYQILNPDELQMMSNAIGLTSKGLNFINFDGTTSGIYNSLILAWPEIVNLEITFLTTRMTHIALSSLIIYSLVKIIYLESQKILHTILLTFPFIIFFVFTKDPDFSHYSTELLSTTLLILSYFIIKKDKNFSKVNTSVAAPILLGFISFSKIQFFPVAIVMYFIIIFEFYLKKEKFKKYLLSFAFFCFPSFLVIFAMVVSGNFKDLLINQFLFTYDFVVSNQSKNILLDIYSSNKDNIQLSIEEGFKNHLYLNLIFHVLYVYFLFFIFLLYKIIKKKKIYIFFSRDLIYISGIVFTLILVILIPGKMHRHYLLSLLPFIALFISKLFFLFKNHIKFELKSPYLKVGSVTIFLFLIISAILESNKFYSKKFEYTNFNKEEIYFESPRIFQYLFQKQTKKSLYIWGWMPKWYAMSYMTPASRETISEKQMIKNISRDYYRKRLLYDLEKNNPSLIIDFVKKNSFRYDKPYQGINNFKDLKLFIKQDYIKLKKLDTDCPDYFLKKHVFKELKKKLVNYSLLNNTKKTIEKLNDFSVTEDICNDAVHFKESDNNLINIDFKKMSNLSKIMILSSKINSEVVNLDIVLHTKKSIIKKSSIKLNKYPFWTNIDFKNVKNVNKIQIDIENLKRRNFGINEIKIYN